MRKCQACVIYIIWLDGPQASLSLFRFILQHYPRSNGGQDIFFAKGDHEKFSFLLQESIERFRISPWALLQDQRHSI